MTYAAVSIEPGSMEALAITAGELRVMHYTGRSVSRGYGKDKVTSYRSGVQTELGDIELSQWQALMRDIIRRSGELELLEQLTEWELETTPWIPTRSDAEQHALEGVPRRWFDNPSHRDFAAFNQKYRPETLQQNQTNNERKEPL